MDQESAIAKPFLRAKTQPADKQEQEEEGIVFPPMQAPAGPPPAAFENVDAVFSAPILLSFDAEKAIFQLGHVGPSRTSLPRKPAHRRASESPTEGLGRPSPPRPQRAAHVDRPAVVVPALDPGTGYAVTVAAEQAVRETAQKKVRPQSAFRAGAAGALSGGAQRPVPKNVCVGKENETQLVGKLGLVPHAWVDGAEFCISGHQQKLWPEA